MKPFLIVNMFCRRKNRHNVLTSLELDFGEIDSKGELMGLVGLGILEKLRAVIDVEIPLVYEKK